MVVAGAGEAAGLLVLLLLLVAAEEAAAVGTVGRTSTNSSWTALVGVDDSVTVCLGWKRGCICSQDARACRSAHTWSQGCAHCCLLLSLLHRVLLAAADNASRCRAVRGTTVIPPGTPAAAAIEQQLMRLAAAGGPLVDVRRLQWDTAAAAAVRQQVALQQQLTAQERQRLRWPRDWWGMESPEQWQQQQEQTRGVRLDPCSYDCDAAFTAAAAAVVSVPGGWGWQPAASAALQAALVSVHAKAAAAAAAVDESSPGQGPASADGSEGDRPELLAALVEQLSGLVPDVQLLVLPVLLPSGR